MTHLTPVQVLERRRELLLNHDTERFADLFAPGGVIEIRSRARICPPGSMASRPSATTPAGSRPQPYGSTTLIRSPFITPTTRRS